MGALELGTKIKNYFINHKHTNYIFITSICSNQTSKIRGKKVNACLSVLIIVVRIARAVWFEVRFKKIFLPIHIVQWIVVWIKTKLCNSRFYNCRTWFIRCASLLNKQSITHQKKWKEVSVASSIGTMLLRGEEDSTFCLFEYNNNILYFASYRCHALFAFHLGFLSLYLCNYYRLYYFILFSSFLFLSITIIGFIAKRKTRVIIPKSTQRITSKKISFHVVLQLK